MRKKSLIALILVVVMACATVYAAVQYTEHVQQSMILKASYQVELRERTGVRITSYQWADFLSRAETKTLEARIVYTGTQAGRLRWSVTNLPSGWLFKVYIGDGTTEWSSVSFRSVNPNDSFDVWLRLTENGAICGQAYSWNFDLIVEDVT